MTKQRKMPLWRPENTEETNIRKFMRYVNKKHDLHLATYDDLWRWSVSPATVREFWKDAYVFLGIPAKSARSDIGVAFDGTTDTTLPLFPPPQFFPSQRFNLAEFIFRNHADDQIAIHYVCEGRAGIEDITWGALKSRTRKAYDAMVNSGVQSGDTVAVVMSNSANAIVLCLATLAIGAGWASASPEMGVQAIVDRYDQIKPKIIFAEDAYVYAGKKIMLGGNIASWLQTLKANNPNLRDVVTVPYFDTSVGTPSISHGVSWEDFTRRGTGLDLSFLQAPFSHPAFILFSSGTTGIPKCIVHSAGGVALKVNLDSRIQHDMRPNDVFFQYTTTAWVMWVLNFVNLSTGGTMLLYNGSPFYPDPDILLRLTEELKVTVFGTSPRYLSELRSRNIIPRERFNLSKLRIVTSTGSVLSEDLYEWFYRVGFPPKAQLISMSGGTDIAGSFVGGCPILPVYAGEIQAKCLGMSIDVFDAARADPISISQLGETGELVCTQPFPSQPLGFYGREGPAKYRAAYFSRYGSSVWCQGDFVQCLPDTNGILMMGRSDGVLNPSGVRFGSAEMYAVTETFPEVLDAICVGQRRKTDNDETVLLFLKMKEGHELTGGLVTSVKAAVKERYSVRHVPTYVFEVADIPYTINGKKCEINVKQIVSGMETKVSGTVANPTCLKEYEKYLHLPRRGGVKL